MIRILHVTPVGERGGVESVLINILRSIDRKLFTSNVVVLQNGPLVRQLEDTGTEVHVVEAGRLREVSRGCRAIGRIVEVIQSCSVDVVHCHNAKALVYGGVAARLAGVPSIFHLHGPRRVALDRHGVMNLISIALCPTAVIPCSVYVAESLSRNWQSHPAIFQIHNGAVPPARNAYAECTVRKELGIPDKAPLIVAATRLQRSKGVHILLKAASEVLHVHRDAHFMIVGGALFGLDSGYPQELEAMLESEGLTKSVHLVGFQPDVVPFYLASDLVVHPAIAPEAFGMVLLEAMSCEKPVVATSSGGVTELVVDGVSGLLVPPGNPGELARAILALLSDPRRRAAMGQAGAARFVNQFTAAKMAAKLETLYRRLLESSKRPNG